MHVVGFIIKKHPVDVYIRIILCADIDRCLFTEGSQY